MDSVKKCNKCGRTLSIDRFYKRKLSSGKMGHRCYCIDCNIIIAMDRHRKHPDKQREINDRWRKNNPEKCRIAVAKWQKNNPDKKKAATAKWYKNNREDVDAYCVKWRRDNQDRYLASVNKHARERRANDPIFRMMSSIRAVMHAALKGNVKSGHTVELLGCSINELREHLERLFQSGMTWNNYGKKGWEIDHIIPLSYFDHSDPEQQKRAWHYTNLQPLWAADNRSKKDKILETQLFLL